MGRQLAIGNGSVDIMSVYSLLLRVGSQGKGKEREPASRGGQSCWGSCWSEEGIGELKESSRGLQVQVQFIVVLLEEGMKSIWNRALCGSPEVEGKPMAVWERQARAEGRKRSSASLGSASCLSFLSH